MLKESKDFNIICKFSGNRGKIRLSERSPNLRVIKLALYKFCKQYGIYLHILQNHPEIKKKIPYEICLM